MYQPVLLPLSILAVCFLEGIYRPHPAHKNGTRPTVRIASGPVVGTTGTVSGTTATVDTYRGIPFALSPPERFSPPTDPVAWTTPLDASEFKSACVQQFNYPADLRNKSMALYSDPSIIESEDCLYLNVFTPSGKAPGHGRPVMFWLHGGDLQFGFSSAVLYDGSSFAANQDVVVVTTNYRTNVFGFSSSPQIPFGKQNSGFLDQRKALEWVQQNIAAFGGNPDNVTIFGESAGGYSVKQLLAQPPSPRTYRAAIMESEATVFAGNSLENWKALVAATSCAAAASQIDCVRKVPATTIKDLIEKNAWDFAPVPDNVTSTNDVRPSILSGRFAKVPFFLGTNSQEGRIFTYASGLESLNLTSAQYLDTLIPGQPELQKAILSAYPAELVARTYDFASQVQTDVLFTCTSSRIGNLASSHGYNVWRYYFNASFPNTQIFPNAGVYHFSEVFEVFGTYPQSNPLGNATQQQIQLSKYMQGAWADFARNPSAGPGWPKLGTNHGVELAELKVDGEQTISLETVDHICAVYDAIIDAQGL